MKRFTAIFLSFAMVLSMAACGQKAATPPAETNPTQETTQAPETAKPEEVAEVNYYPLTVTDQAGREVTIETEPQKIVSGYYISSSLLIALGQEDKLVGMEAKADKRAIYRLSAPELMELPSVGTAKEFDLEGCAALEPDLVILPVKLKEAADRLAELGIPTILVNPENQQLLDEARALVAKSLNCQEKAQALDDFTAKTQTALQEQLADAEKPSVYLAGNSSLLSTAGGKMYQSSLIDLAQGQNVAAEIQDNYWAEVSYEQILTWDPEYIILAADASYTVEEVLADPNLAGVSAVENGKVYQLPNTAEAWDSPVPSGILGAVWMASVLHPEQVTEEQRNGVIEEFYNTFYGFSYAEA